MMRYLTRLFTMPLAIVAASQFAAAPASAHPHVWSDMRSDLVLDEQGRAVAINVEWIFDAGYTEAAT